MTRLLSIGLAIGLAFLAGTAMPIMAAEEAGPDQATAAIAKMIETFEAAGKIDKTAPKWRTKLPKPQKVTFDPAKTYLMRMTTSKGEIVFKMYPDVAPMHVTSFMYLSKLGFYDGLTFHRVIPGFMAQGGDPLGNGMGGPGYNYGGEFSKDVKHDRRGMLSMANRGPKTDGSQFFITFAVTSHLDNRHTIAGEVVEGMETLAALEAVGSRSGRTTEQVKIEKVSFEVR